MTDTELEAWGAFVRTGWVPEALRLRLADGAVIVRVWSERQLCGTCVVRPRDSDGLWILETLVARPRGSGWGAATMHAAVRAVWDHGGSSIGFVWEMPVGGLVRAWWRGWMGAAVSVEWGWTWRAPVAAAECGFCPNTKAWLPERAPPVMPVVVSAENGGWTAVVSDSGLWDGWGHVLAVSGVPDWGSVAAAGGWRDLWYAGAAAPAGGWRWTGEVVVRAILNRAGRPVVASTAWITAEITSGGVS